MLEAVVFDWAGTLVDFGSRAPLQAFVELFKGKGIDISFEEAREPMGTEKRDHITRLLDNPRIKGEWIRVFGQPATEADIDQLYQNLIPLQKKQIDLHSHLIDGAIDTLSYLRSKNISIGTTTGYGRQMITNLLANASAQGLTPDNVVAADDVGIGRPYATAALENLVKLKVKSVRNCVKVDDTEPGIAEGINAGMWTVTVVLSGNTLGFSLEDWENLSIADREMHKLAAYERARSFGSHFCIDSVAQLPKVLEEIELRIARGEKP